MFNGRRSLVILAITLVLSTAAYAGLSVLPQESVAGNHEKYTMRVPNQRDSASLTQIEVQFPAGLEIYGYEPKQGWKVDLKRDVKGRISGAVWTGNLGPHEFVEFGLLGVNPKVATTLVWTTTQIYDDGTREEYTNARGTKLQAPLVAVRQSGSSSLRLGK
jgi:uncharacterized protein YcnI